MGGLLWKAITAPFITSLPKTTLKCNKQFFKFKYTMRKKTVEEPLARKIEKEEQRGTEFISYEYLLKCYNK